jgi:hypothetical protein
MRDAMPFIKYAVIRSSLANTSFALHNFPALEMIHPYALPVWITENKPFDDLSDTALYDYIYHNKRHQEFLQHLLAKDRRKVVSKLLFWVVIETKREVLEGKVPRCGQPRVSLHQKIEATSGQIETRYFR